MGTRILRAHGVILAAALSMLLAGSPRTHAQDTSPAPVTSHVDTATRADDAARARIVDPKPLSPTARDARNPAYQLYLEYDLPVLGIGLVFAASRLLLEQKAYCAPRCDAQNLNALDRTTAGVWRPAWQRTSDAGIAVLAGGAALLLFLDEGFVAGLNDGVVVAESALAAMATTSLMTLAVGRPRPFLYGDEAPLGKRNGADAGLSFLSSHTATAFATATALFVTMRRLHPRDGRVFVVAGAGALLASLVAAARVLGGMHFITDAVGGAIIGMSTGVLVPALHDAPLRIVPSASARHRGLSVVARF
ncbi:MAG: phosphatase PAP2 family protein [Polyangiales bacterium]